MRGPTDELKKRADEVEVIYHRANDKLKEHVRLFLEFDENEDDAKRNKKHLRDNFIVPRMKRLKKHSLMISQSEGVRLDRILSLSKKSKESISQTKKLRALAIRFGAPEPVSEERIISRSITPEFREWLVENPEVAIMAYKIASGFRLCPIREDKEHKGEILAECEH